WASAVAGRMGAVALPARRAAPDFRNRRRDAAAARKRPGSSQHAQLTCIAECFFSFMSSSLAAREDELNHYSNVETMRSIGTPAPLRTKRPRCRGRPGVAENQRIGGTTR